MAKKPPALKNVQIPIDKLVVWPELDMFPNPNTGVDVEKDIKESIEAHGFSPAEPIVAWKGAANEGHGHVIVDGHTRYRSAKKAKQHTVSGVLMEFGNLAEAQEYAFRRQKSRRNISVGVLALAGIQAREHAGKDETTTKELAKLWDIGTATIDWARSLARRGKPNEIKAVLDETIGLKAAYAKMRTREKREAKASEDPPLMPEPDIDPEVEGDGKLHDVSSEEIPKDDSPEYEALRDSLGELMDEAGDLEHYLSRGENRSNAQTIEEKVEVVENRWNSVSAAHKDLQKAQEKAAKAAAKKAKPKAKRKRKAKAA